MNVDQIGNKKKAYSDSNHVLNIRSRADATNGLVLLPGHKATDYHVVFPGMPTYRICCSRTIDLGVTHRLDGASFALNQFSMKLLPHYYFTLKNVLNSLC